MDNQLPAEVLEKIKRDAEIYQQHRTVTAKRGYIAGATEYATKLHQVEQENKELKQWQIEAIAVLDPILDYGRSKEAGIPLGRSITNVLLERCKQADVVRALLEKVISRHEAGLLPDRFIYHEIKTFLDGK